MVEQTDEVDASLPRENPAIERFRSDCMLFLDFNRPVFLEEIERFIWSANEEELVKLRKRIAARTKNIKAHRGKRGRPRGRSDEDWLTRARIVAWRHHVQGWTWKQIALDVGLKPTKENFRTLQRRRDSFAAVVWDALQEPLSWGDPSPDRIKQALERLRDRQWLWVKTGLPFRDAPEECKAIVQALAPLGRVASAKEFDRKISYRAKSNATMPSVKKSP
jgi:hypothetical protein